MRWTIEFAPEALKELNKLGAEPARRIATLNDPRSVGTALGESSGYWRYRIGDYRVIARIEEGLVLISVIRVAHRREVYRG